MNNSALQFVPLLLLLALYVPFIKLAALICRFRLSWGLAFVFSATIGALVLALRAIPLFFDVLVPFYVAAPLGFAIPVVIGGWLFKSRMTNKGGVAVGWWGAAGVSALAFALLMVGAVFWFWLPTVLLNANQP